jgi:uncharacterized membrane protein
VALAFILVRVDEVSGETLIEEVGWVYSGGPEGARAVLSTIAGSVLGVAGVTFSITIAALTLASSQFGPRLLANFMRDTGNQIVLGTFIATFLYCLLVLRTIRGGEGSAFVPQLSVTAGVGLAIASLGVLIFFIHHVALSIQAPQVVGNVAADLHRTIEKLYPRQIGSGPREAGPGPDRQQVPESFEEHNSPVLSHHNGYIQAVGDERLMELATEHDVVLRIEHSPGDWVVRDQPLVRVWPDSKASAELCDEISEAFILGHRRTNVQDLAFTIHQLVEVAVRALSPGINDPFTAIQCVDQLSAGLVHLAGIDFPAALRVDDAGKLRIIAADGPTFRGMVDAAFNQIRQYGRDSVAVTIRLLEAIETVLPFTRYDEQRAALLRQAEMILDGSEDQIPEPQDRTDVKARYNRVLRIAEIHAGRAGSREAKQPV